MENWLFEFTPEKLARCVKRNQDPQALFNALEAVLPRYEINTVDRVAAFLAQCGHESADFTILEENLNYSAKGLRNTWPARFPSEEAAQPYHRKPKMIANKVYANRMGNGSEDSGDGWRFRGRGAIQLTGRSNYQAFADTFGWTLEEAVAYTETLQGAVESAAWFWWKNKINDIADRRDIKAMTRRINGGVIGLADREAHYNHIYKVLSS